MSANELAIKYGTHAPEVILAVLPIDEASDIIRQQLRYEVRRELESEFEERIYEAEEDAGEWESRADSFECDAIALARGIEEAMKANSLEEANIILDRLKRDHDEYF